MPEGRAVSACQTVETDAPASRKARTASRSRLEPGKTITAAFMVDAIRCAKSGGMNEP